MAATAASLLAATVLMLARQQAASPLADLAELLVLAATR
jgi:hypothetical protein